MIRGAGRATDQERAASAKRPATLLDRGEIAIYRITSPGGWYVDAEGVFGVVGDGIPFVRAGKNVSIFPPGSTVTRAPGVQVWPLIKRNIER